MRSIGETFEAGALLIAASGGAEELNRLAEEEKQRGRLAVLEFVARHGCIEIGRSRQVYCCCF